MTTIEKRKTGRKTLDSLQKKQHLQLYIEGYKVEKLGGKEAVENLCRLEIEKKLKNNLFIQK